MKEEEECCWLVRVVGNSTGEAVIRARERVVALSESGREFVERRRSGLVCKKCEAGQADLCVISRESRARGSEEGGAGAGAE